MMQHPSKTRTWANDDVIPAVTVSSEPAVVETDGNQDKPSRPVKKSKVVETETPRQPSKTPAVQTDTIDEDSEHEGDKTEKDASEEDDQPKSDMDWLRSKTSRLLGLLDEEEQAESSPRPAAPANNTVEPIEEDESDEVEETPVAEEPAEEKDYNADVELIRISGRLFLRNLAYDATEADLETIFAPFGKIDEVSFTLHSLYGLKIVARMMIILIGTSDMQSIRDVNRKRILVDAS